MSNDYKVLEKEITTAQDLEDVQKLQWAARIYNGVVPFAAQYGNCLPDFPLQQVTEEQHRIQRQIQEQTEYILTPELKKLMKDADKVESAGDDDASHLAQGVKRALRFNDSKVPLNLLPADAEEEEAKVWMCGLRKYPPAGKQPDGRTIQNWEVLWGEDTLDVALGCAMRHLAELRKGNFWEVQRDREGNIMRWPDGTPVVTHHAASVRTNMAMVIRYLEQNFAEAKVKLIEENKI